MKIHEILTEDVEQLDELNWKKAAAAATLAGAGLFGGGQADAQTYELDKIKSIQSAGENLSRSITNLDHLFKSLTPIQLSNLASSIGICWGGLEAASKSNMLTKMPNGEKIKQDAKKYVGINKMVADWGRAAKVKDFPLSKLEEEKERIGEFIKLALNSTRSTDVNKALGLIDKCLNWSKNRERDLFSSPTQQTPKASSSNNKTSKIDVSSGDKTIQVKDKNLGNGKKYTGSWTYYGAEDKEGEPTWEKVGEITEKDGTKSIGVMGKYGIKPGQGKIITKNGETVSGTWEPDERAESETAIIFMPTNKTDFSKISYMFPEHPYLKKQTTQPSDSSPKAAADAEAKKNAAKKAAADKALKDAFRADASGADGLNPTPPPNSKVINYKTGGPSDPKSWNGQVSAGQLPNGKGIMTYNNGSMLFGEFQNGSPKAGTQASYKKTVNSTWVTGKLVKDKDGKIQFSNR